MSFSFANDRIPEFGQGHCRRGAGGACFLGRRLWQSAAVFRRYVRSTHRLARGPAHPGCLIPPWRIPRPARAHG